MPEIRLDGCRTRPLIGYLKALGLLRAVAQQADGSARGRWHNDVFHLRSRLSSEELRVFLRDEYRPAPILSPWNGRCGFYPKGNAAAVRNLGGIEGSDDPRLDAYRQLIAATRALLSEIGVAEKPGEEAKGQLLRCLRRRWPDDALEWLDAAVVLGMDSPRFPPLLGSGGNDGSYDFSSNYMEAIGEAVLGDHSRSNSLLAHALSGTPTPLSGTNLDFLFRDASVTNSPSLDSNGVGNPWDLILGLEGTLVLTAGVVRRHDSHLPGHLSAPFTVNATAGGYGSATNGESGWAELWLPLWDGWAALGELAALAREARAQVGGGRRRQATTGLDFARAAGELGVARGITAFERYVVLERAGQSRLAVPAGRITVEERPAVLALREIESWLSTLSRYASRKECPQGPRATIAGLERAAFEMASTGKPETVCATLEAIGSVEAALARSSSSAQVLKPLRGAAADPWVKAADDGTAELAVAVGLASLRDGRPRNGGSAKSRAPLPTMRDYLHGTTTQPDGKVSYDPRREHAIGGSTLATILAALHARRHMEGARTEVGLAYEYGTWTPLVAARSLARGLLDEDRILALLRGLSVFDFDRRARRGQGPARVLPPPSATAEPPPEPIFELLTLAWQPRIAGGEGDPRAKRVAADPRPAPGSFEIAPQPDWAARLAAGAVRPVVEDALRRLRFAGLPPIPIAADLVPVPGPNRDLGCRLAAALLLHLGSRDMGKLVGAFIEEEQKDKQDEREDQ